MLVPSNLEGGFWVRESCLAGQRGTGGSKAYWYFVGAGGHVERGTVQGQRARGPAMPWPMVGAWITNDVVASSKKGLVGAKNQRATRVGRRQEMLEQDLLRCWRRVCGGGFVCQC